MTVFAAIGIAACCTLIVVAGVGSLIVALRARRISRRASLIQSHATVVALSGVSDIASRFALVAPKAAQASANLQRLSKSISQIAAGLAIISLNVDRVSFATRFLLRTLVPTLAGTLSQK